MVSVSWIKSRCGVSGLGSEVRVPKILGPQKEEGGKEGERVGRRVAIDIRSERVGPCKAGERVRSTDGGRE